jgi:hypothetical protein
VTRATLPASARAADVCGFTDIFIGKMLRHDD